MPRKKKNEQLTEQQVWDVINFARQMYNVMPSVYTPELVNARLKDINMNPLAATQKDIDKALLNPKNNELQLRGFSEFFEYTNMLYKRMLAYLGNMLSFDLTYTCTNAAKEDYTSKQYKKDESAVKDFLDKFNHKNEFKKVTRQLVRQEVEFTVFRDDGEKYVLQELPTDFCVISGRNEFSYMFDFNMQWFFNNGGVSIDMYPPIFKQFYKRIMDKKQNGYDPASSNRTGEWIYWVQTNVNDGFFAFKFNQEQAGLVPFLAPMFADTVLAPMIRKLQTNKYVIEASRILIGMIPMLKDNKSGNVKDMLAISPEVAGQFANLVRQGIPDAINFAVGAWEDVKQIDFHTDNSNMMADYNKNMSATSGINSRLLYATDKMTAEETRNSISVDSYMMTYLYPMFESFLDLYVNQRTKKFKFKFRLSGVEFEMDRKNRLETAMTLADKGIFLPQLIANAIGMLPQDLERMLDEAKANKWDEKLIPILNAYTMTSDKGGRPQKSNGELTDSGQQARDDGSNQNKGGSV